MIIHKIIFGPVLCLLDREAREKAKEAFLRVHSNVLQVLESQKDDDIAADSIGYILERFVTNVEHYRLDCKKPAEVLVETMLKAIHAWNIEYQHFAYVPGTNFQKIAVVGSKEESAVEDENKPSLYYLLDFLDRWNMLGVFGLERGE